MVIDIALEETGLGETSDERIHNSVHSFSDARKASI
jgi:hypothetical protein